MDQRWSMYNKVEKLRIDGLGTEQVRTILLAIPTRRMVQWYACREGDMQWRPLHEITEFYEDVRVLKGSNEETTREHKVEKPQSPPLVHVEPQRRPLFEEAPEDLEEDDDLVVMTSNVKERRNTRRFFRQLEFEVKSGDQVFSSETYDISVNGLSIKEPLPKWVSKTFRAELKHSGSSVQILCTRVSDNKLQLVDADSWDKIRQWIVKG